METLHAQLKEALAARQALRRELEKTQDPIKQGTIENQLFNANFKVHEIKQAISAKIKEQGGDANE